MPLCQNGVVLTLLEYYVLNKRNRFVSGAKILLDGPRL